jgi:tRNA(Ile)-lysidine synthase
MSAVREIDGCRLLRPLLATPKARLHATLEAEGQAFLSDPSNENPAFERSRLRSRPLAVDPQALDAEIAAYARARAARAQHRDRLSLRAVAIHPAGFAAVDPGAILAASRKEGEGLLAALAATIGGGEYAPRRERVARLLQMLRAEPGRGRTLGGCRFLAWRGRVLVLRELACAAPPARLSAGAENLWDRRFAVAAPEGAAAGLVVGYVGQAGIFLGPLPAAKPTMPPLVHAVLPALWDEEGLVAVPALRYRRKGAGTLLRIAFRPARPLTSAGFTVV